MIDPLYHQKDFAQCRDILESVGWRVRERSSTDYEVPHAPLIAFLPRLALKVAVYTLEDLQLLAQSVSKRTL